MEKKKVASTGFGAAKLREIGAFTPAKGIEKTIEWQNQETGEEFDFQVFVQKQSFGRFADLVKKSEGDKVQGAALIAQCLYEDEDCRKRLMSYNEALDLEPSLAMKLFAVIEEVNDPKKPSLPKTNSSSN